MKFMTFRNTDKLHLKNDKLSYYNLIKGGRHGKTEVVEKTKRFKPS